jgi:hypothetical protein
MTQTFRPALIGLLPALALALLLALLLSGRPSPAIPNNPVIELPGIGTTPTSAPAAPADAAPVIENTATTPPSATAMPGPGPAIEPSVTAAPGAKEMPGPGRLMGDQQDPWPYPNLPNGKGPASQ